MNETKSVSISLGTVICIYIIIILVISLFGMWYYYNHIANKDNQTEMTNNVTSQSNVVETSKSKSKEKKIDEEAIEKNIKKVLIEKIGKSKEEGLYCPENGVYAECHKILRTEVKDNQVYVYVTASIGTYLLENGEYELKSGLATPIVIIFDIDEDTEYTYSKYNMPEDGMGWENSLKQLFPEDLVEEAANTDYETDFYQKQISEYLK